MKLGMKKQVLAAGLCVMMLCGDILPTTASASVSGGDAIDETAVEMNTVSGNEMTVSDGNLTDTVLTKTVSGVTITLTAPASVVPEGAELWAEEIKQSNQLKTIDQALETEAEKKDIAVRQYKAFDIKLLVNGETVQPADNVKVVFTGDILLPANKDENVAVYHVTEDAVANEMSAVVTEDSVEMSTEHFSVYVITVVDTAEQKSYDVTVSHHLENSTEPFYKTRTFTVDKEQVVTVPVQGGSDYQVTKVLLNGVDITNEPGTIVNGVVTVAKEIDKDSFVELYYVPTTNDDMRNAVTYFDYSILSSEKRMEEENFPLDWGAKVTFEYKGKKYENTEYRGSGKFYVGETNVLTVAEGDILENVTSVLYGTTSTADEIKAVSLWGSIKFTHKVEKTYSSTKNAGINSHGIGHEQEFLAIGQTGAYHDYKLMVNKNGVDLNANVNNSVGGTNPDKAIIPNLVTGLTSDYEDIVTGPGVYEPGYFNKEPLEGKTVYTDRFELKFAREGHKYVLRSSVDTQYVEKEGDAPKEKETMAGRGVADFFPLNDVPRNDTADAVAAAGGTTEPIGENNCFFGMRYDFTFTVGDYAGPLQYIFEGDDDVWVFLNGQKVLDLGGMHQTYPGAYGPDTADKYDSNTVDLWQVRDADNNLIIDPADEKKVYQVTVLYMERGAWESNCYMEFVAPNATLLDNVITEKPRGTAEFTKVNESGSALSGAIFGLYTADQENLVQTAASGADGVIRFTEVTPGDYYVKEITAPDGYELNPNKFNVTIVSEETVQVNGGKIINQQKYGEFTLKKADKFTGRSLAGAEFELLTEDGNTKVGEAVSDGDGNIRFAHIPLNESGRVYILKETKAPDGYELLNTTWKIQVNQEKDGFVSIKVSNGAAGTYKWEDNTLVILNEKKPVTVKVVKTWLDADGNQDMNPDVTEIQVELYREHEGANDKELVETITLTKENGWSYTGTDFPRENEKGDWNYFVEERAVDGYILEGEIQKNESVDEATQQTAITFTLTNRPDVGDLKITKTIDKLNMVYGTASFTFKIIGSDGLILYRTLTFDGKSGKYKELTIEDIPAGKYTVVEMDNIRYMQESVSVIVDGIEIPNQNTAYVTTDSTPVFAFTNVQKPEKYYSHSDIVVNSFRQNSDGSIEVSRNYEVLEKKDIAVK